MELHSFIISNRHTPGKYYRNLKNLRKADPKAEIKTPLPEDIKTYMEILLKKGLEIHQGIVLSTFYTKNLLPYTGIMTQKSLFPNEILLKIPRGLLLTTKRAYFSELQNVFDENPEFYSRYLERNWEDHMLLTFLLYEYQKEQQSHWHFLIKLLPRDIDYLAFWNEKELDLLEDPYMKAKAKLLLLEFEKTYEKLNKILNNYPDLFRKETFSYENVKWIHIHLITRSFGGKYLKYVTMVPFAEFFNHECTNVYYDFIQNKQENCEENQVFCEEDSFSTSNESNNSQESNDFEDFQDINGENLENIIEKNEQILDKTLIENEKFAENFREIIEWIINSLDLGDIVSCYYFNEVLRSLTKLKKKLLTKKNIKNTNDLKEIHHGFSELQTLNVKYKFHLFQYITENNKGSETEPAIILTQKKVFLENIEENPEEKKEKLKEMKFCDPALWPDDDFEYMILKNSEKDYFHKNSQVYFCYGRLSNRKLLLRYGLALEHNKYDHIFIKVPVFKFLKCVHQDLVKYFNSFKLSKCKNFKLQATKFNLDLLLFAKGILWDIEKNKVEELFETINMELELNALNLMKGIVENKLNFGFKTEYIENLELIEKENLNYHQHFATIYRVERQRLLKMHKKIIEVAIEIVKKLKNGVNIKKAIEKIEEIESEEEWQRNRLILKCFLDRFN